MADGRSQAVLSKLVDIASYANYVIDRFPDAGEPQGKNEVIKIPNIGAMTVYSDGSVARQAGARNDPTVTELSLTVDSEPWIPVQIPKRDKIQNLQGAWSDQISQQGLVYLRNHIDQMLIDDYITGELCWLASGVDTYHLNEDASSLSAPDILLARGLALRNTGTMLQNLLLILDPLAAAAVMGFTGWVPLDSNDSFGPQTIGRIYGIEVVETQGLRVSKTWPIATAAVSSSVMTLTFAENPGLVVGQQIKTSGLQSTYDLPSGTDVVSVNSTGLTVTAASGGSNDADVLGSGNLLVMDSAQNILVDRAHVHRAFQAVPEVRIVPDPDTTGDIMQISALLGMIGRAGRAYVIHSPPSSI